MSKRFKIVNKKKLTCISYNVSWKVMTDDKSINKICLNKPSSKHNLCKINILSNIKSLAEKYEPDFLSFQEASNYEAIIDKLDTKSYEHYINISGMETMLTIWNKNKITVLQSYSGEFMDGRPFAIIVYKDKKYDDYISYYINIHASHNVNTQIFIIDILNKWIDKNIDKKFKDKDKIKHVSISGDFNRNIHTDDTSKYELIINNKKFKLLHKSKRIIDNYSNYNTCCDNTGKNLLNKFDHVIHSNSVTELKIKMNNNNSDHSPIVSILDL